MIVDESPDIVINAAAYTAVDRAESEPDLAHRINANAPATMANAALDAGAAFIHFSTDYVFRGDANRPYTEADPTDPKSVYGKTKLAGDLAVLQTGARATIFRLAWVYSNQGRNFLNTMICLSHSGSPIRVVNDQIGAPTWAQAIANATLDVIDRHALQPGVFNMTASGQASWYEFARAIFQLTGRDVSCEPISTCEYPTPASRPSYSVLDGAKLTRECGISMTDWRHQLTECWAERPLSDR